MRRRSVRENEGEKKYLGLPFDEGRDSLQGPSPGYFLLTGPLPGGIWRLVGKKATYERVCFARDEPGGNPPDPPLSAWLAGAFGLAMWPQLS